jgi:cytochrome c-type biogenesis protein CcmE
MNKFYITLILSMLLVISWTIYLTQYDERNLSSVKYFTVSELSDNVSPINKMKLGGRILPESIKINPDNLLEVSFYVYDAENTVLVEYNGIRPDLFKDDAEVVVTGSYSDNRIIAEDLQTKCASRYEGDLKNKSSI